MPCWVVLRRRGLDCGLRRRYGRLVATIPPEQVLAKAVAAHAAIANAAREVADEIRKEREARDMRATAEQTTAPAPER